MYTYENDDDLKVLKINFLKILKTTKFNGLHIYVMHEKWVVLRFYFFQIFFKLNFN
jgi:hypothetical protein